MKVENFIAELQETLEFETPLKKETNFKDVQEWDSLTAMVLMSYVKDNFGVKLNATDLDKLTTVSSLIDKIGQEKFEN